MNSSAFPGHPLIWNRMGEHVKEGFAKWGLTADGGGGVAESLITAGEETATDPLMDSVRSIIVRLASSCMPRLSLATAEKTADLSLQLQPTICSRSTTIGP